MTQETSDELKRALAYLESTAYTASSYYQFNDDVLKTVDTDVLMLEQLTSIREKAEEMIEKLLKEGVAIPWRKSQDKWTYLNRDTGGHPYEMHLHVRVNGDDLPGAADSVCEYITDHADELLFPVERK